MKTLKEIAYTLTRYQVRQVDVITNPDLKPSKKDNRYWEAYLGLREQRWEDDVAFAAHFGMEYPSKNYNRFKNELKERFWNTLLFTEATGDDVNEYISLYHSLLQKWSVTEILKHRAAYQAYRELANDCLNTAQKYEFVKMVVDITHSLKGHYFLFANFKAEYQRVKAIYNEYWPIYLAEVAMFNAYEEFVTNFVTIKGYKKDHARAAAALVTAFEAQAAQVTSIDFQFHYRILQFYAKSLCHDWPAALLVANEAIEFFESKKFLVRSFLIGFNYQKASCLLMLGRYEEASVVLDNSLSLTAVDSSHHFKNRELATVTALYVGKYAEAWDFCKTAMQKERFKKIPSIDQETWRIYYGYLHFLAQTGRMELSPKEKAELPSFRLSTWLNDLPLYSLDKRGAQIPVLILQTLLLFSENRWDELENRIEALRKFRQRNLDANNEHFRTNCFIHLLELLPKNGFSLPALKAAAAPWLQKLSLGQLDILDRTYEIEVVPYESQWAWIEEIAGMKNGQ